MTPETLFALAGSWMAIGWLALVLAPLAPRVADWTATIVVPAVFAVAYTGIILAFWAGREGGYEDLASVMRLFDNPWLALAGWLHFLAFDLFVGAWEVRTARRVGMPHWLVLPCLPVTLLFGPAGYLMFLTLRAAHATARAPKVPA